MKTVTLFLTCLALLCLNLEVSLAQCVGCPTFGSGLSTTERLNLATQFAPQLRFDNGANTYPLNATDIFTNSSNNTGCNSNNQLNQTVADDFGVIHDWNVAKPQITTYFVIQNSGDRYFIDYWWTYYRQPNCFGSSGGHDYDWEHITVQVKKIGNTYQKVSVTFFQHGGWYTRRFESGSIEVTGDHPISYVGKLGHGNYHNGARCGFIQCCYYGDCRNTSNRRYLDVWTSNKLFEISCNDTWANWPGKWGTTGEGPLYKVQRKFPKGYIDAPACKGDSRSCGLGDSQQGCQRSNFSKGTTLGQITFTASRQATNLVTPISQEETLEPLESCQCVKAYPNPVQEVLILEGVEAETELSIVNQNGDEILHTIYKNELNVSTLSKGIYYIVRQGEKSIRFVKQ